MTFHMLLPAFFFSLPNRRFDVRDIFTEEAPRLGWGQLAHGHGHVVPQSVVHSASLQPASHFRGRLTSGRLVSDQKQKVPH